MAKRTKKEELLKRYKESFDLFIKNNGDESVFKYLTKKYDVTRATVLTYIRNYKNNVVDPKPTEDELKEYLRIRQEEYRLRHIDKSKEELVMKNPYLFSKGLLDSIKETKIDKALIEKLLTIFTKEELNDFAINSNYTVYKIIEEIRLTLIYGDNALIEQKRKLQKIAESLEAEKDIINYSKIKRKRENEKGTNYTSKYVDEVKTILEETLLKGKETFLENLAKSLITENLFLEYVNRLQRGNEVEKALYTFYNNEIKFTKETLLEKTHQIIKYLKEGIQKRSYTYFNMSDYFHIINLDLTEFLKLAHEYKGNNLITEEEFELIKNFVYYYYPKMNVLTKEEIHATEDLLDEPEKNMIIDQIENDLGVKLYKELYENIRDEYIRESLHAEMKKK